MQKIITLTAAFMLLIGGVMYAQSRDTGYYRSFDGTRIYYEVAGSGSPVVLLHGFMNTGENMKRNDVYARLIDAGYKVVTLDLRGNGKSDKPHDDSSYANDAEAKDIIGLANALALDHYFILGYSRGSIIAARVMVLDKRVTKAVLGGMGADFTDPQWPRRILFYRALKGDKVPELEGVIQHVEAAKLDRQALMLQQKYQPSTPRDTLKAIRIPVLVIAGDKDSDNGSASELAALFPNAQFAVVPGDHSGAQKTPEFADAVLRFLR